MCGMYLGNQTQRRKGAELTDATLLRSLPSQKIKISASLRLCVCKMFKYVYNKKIRIFAAVSETERNETVALLDRIADRDYCLSESQRRGCVGGSRKADAGISRFGFVSA